MRVQVQNVTYFWKKKELLITRGVKLFWLAFTQGGRLVVKLKGFDRYYFDPDNGAIYSKVSSGHYRPIKRYSDGGRDWFNLFKNGCLRKVFWVDILRENMGGIEVFYSEQNKESRKGRIDLRLVS